MPSFNVMLKPSSSGCDMYCDYCFYRDEAENRETMNFGFMTEATLKNVIRKTITHSDHVITYAFQGGEPTLRGLDFFREAVRLEKQYNRNGIQVNNALQTNGFSIDEEWCAFLKENRFLVGISIDGTKDTHDRLRHDKKGNGTYDRVRRSADLLEKYGVDYNILTVVTSETAPEIGRIYREYERNGWRYQQYIACLDPLGEKRGSFPYALTPDAYGEFLVRLFRLWDEDLKKGKQPYIRQFENYVGILLGQQPEACDMTGTCGIQYVVEGDGSVYPCDFYMLDEWRLGNFNTDRLDAIDAARDRSGFRERSMRLVPECGKCPYARVCRGGCQRHRDPMENSPYWRNYFCPAYKAFFGECLPRLEEIASLVRSGGRA